MNGERAPSEPDDDKAGWIYCHDMIEDRSAIRGIPWLFRDRLPEMGTALLIGPSEVGKSFLAVDLARAVATGSEFFGVRPSGRAGAIIFAAEDWQGVRTRLLAVGSDALPIRAAFVESFCLTRTQDCVGRLIEEAANAFRKEFSCRIGVVIIDTLSASGLLADENSNTDCSRAMQILARLSEEHGCLVLAIHHPGKRDDGVRGGSALFASADVVLKARERKAGVRTLECAKNRNAATGSWGSFALVPHVIGRDRDGTEITTLRVSALEAGCTSTLTDVPHELAKSIVSAIGMRTMRKDLQSPGSVHPLVAECAKVDFTTPSGRRRVKAVLSALLASGILVEGVELIGGRYRPTIFVPPDKSGIDHTGSQRSAPAAPPPPV